MTGSAIDPIPWETKRRLIEAAEAERTRCMQAFFVGGVRLLWRSSRRLLSALRSPQLERFAPSDRHEHVGRS